MPSDAAIPSLLDNSEFLAELDKLEGDPAQPKANAISAYEKHRSRVDGADEGRLSTVLAEPRATAPAVGVRRSRSAKPVQPVRLEKPLRLEAPGRIENPFRPETPVRSERPVKAERPLRPVHVDEIGDTSGRAASVRQPLLVPALLVALTVVLCFGAGAGSAVLVFHDRVAQIAATWGK